MENKKAKAPPGIILESEFFNDPRVIKLSDDHGPLAVLSLLNIWTVLNDTDEGRISVDLVSTIGRQFGNSKKQIENIIEAATALNLLCKDLEYIYHPKIIERRKAFAKKQENYSQARKKSIERESSEDSPRILPESSTAPHRSISLSISDQDHIQVLDQEGGAGETKPIPQKPPKPKLKDQIKYPIELDFPVVHRALGEWLEHKESLKKPYKSIVSIQKLLTHWSKYGADEFIKSIDQSIRNGWAGLFEIREESKKEARINQPKSSAISNHMISMNAVNDILKGTL